MVAAAADRSIQNRAPLPLSCCYRSAGMVKPSTHHLLWGGYACLSVCQGMLRGVWRAESVEPSWWAGGLKYSGIRW